MRFFLILLFVLINASPVYAAEERLERETAVEIWLPPDFQSGKGPWPLLIYSHGFGGCAKQSVFLTSYLADQGYIVAAPEHDDGKICNAMSAFDRSEMNPALPEKPFRQPEAWNDAIYAGRRNDVLFTLKSLMDDPQFKGYIDEDHIGLIGYSLGGYTTLGLAGAWPTWKDKRFKAVLALSPYADPFIMKRTLGKIDVPVMYQGGTRDSVITPSLRKRSGGAYFQTRAPRYFIEINGAGHESWTMKDTRYEDLINAGALSFFDKYLRGKDVVVLPRGGKTKGVSTYWMEETPPE